MVGSNVVSAGSHHSDVNPHKDVHPYSDSNLHSNVNKDVHPHSDVNLHSDVHWVEMSVHNTFADGITHKIFSGVTIESSHIRYSGDDGVAIWSGDTETAADVNFTFRNNRISLNTQGEWLLVYSILRVSGRLV
jgi:polygalacturonase